MAGRTIKTNLALRVKGWRAAVKSPKTPSELKPGLRRLIRKASARLRQKRAQKVDVELETSSELASSVHRPFFNSR